MVLLHTLLRNGSFIEPRQDSMVNLRMPINKVCFLVVAGYFKARRKFFARQFHQTDIEYVARQIGVDPSEVFIESYSKDTYARHQRAILSYFGYSRGTTTIPSFLGHKAATTLFKPLVTITSCVPDRP